jgi:hypothetical protein
MASLVRRLLPVSRGWGRKRPRAMMDSPRRIRAAWSSGGDGTVPPWPPSSLFGGAERERVRSRDGRPGMAQPADVMSVTARWASGKQFCVDCGATPSPSNRKSHVNAKPRGPETPDDINRIAPGNDQCVGFPAVERKRCPRCASSSGDAPAASFRIRLRSSGCFHPLLVHRSKFIHGSRDPPRVRVG